MARTFMRKGYGRIYVQRVQDIGRVQQAIRDLDEFEYGYMPADLITVFDNYPKTVFTGKFDALDLDVLQAVCWARGVPIFVLDAGLEEHPDNLLEKVPGFIGIHPPVQGDAFQHPRINITEYQAATLSSNLEDEYDGGGACKLIIEGDWVWGYEDDQGVSIELKRMPTPKPKMPMKVKKIVGKPITPDDD